MKETYAQVLRAIQYARQEIHWKPGKAEQHLDKRIRLGHLSSRTTLNVYQAIIRRVLNEPQAEVFLFNYGGINYPTVVATLFEQLWLVMLDMDGRMETAFVVEEPDTYFADPRFTYLSKLAELER